MAATDTLPIIEIVMVIMVAIYQTPKDLCNDMPCHLWDIRPPEKGRKRPDFGCLEGNERAPALSCGNLVFELIIVFNSPADKGPGQQPGHKDQKPVLEAGHGNDLIMAEGKMAVPG